VLNVFVRDIGQIVPVVLQFVFWLTPIVYRVEVIPSRYRGWLILNPLIPIITGYQDALLYDHAPNWAGLGLVALIAAALLGFSLVLFRKASPEMVDQL
jgi:lipopolysaccharide transport system permease protein